MIYSISTRLRVNECGIGGLFLSPAGLRVADKRQEIKWMRDYLKIE